MQLNSIILLVFLCVTAPSLLKVNAEGIECILTDDLSKEINSYRNIVKTIIQETINGTFKGKTWQELAFFVDTFGPRPSGSKILEASIDYILDQSKHYGLDNVHGEYVNVPHWER